MWWFIPVTSAFKKQRQEEWLVYMVSSRTERAMY